MSEEKLSSELATDPYHEEAFLELYVGEEEWGEIYEEDGTLELKLKIYPPQNGSHYLFSLVELQQLLNDAVAKMQRREA